MAKRVGGKGGEATRLIHSRAPEGPLAATGFVTPWLAAAAMSVSSLLVMGNSMRLRKGAKV